MSESFFYAKKIRKQFPGVIALDGVNITFHSGEVHSIVGENGAGKSTLIKILSGALKPDSGSIWIDQRQIIFDNPLQGLDYGIRVIYQELTLLPELTVAENIFLNRQPLNSFGMIDYRRMNEMAKQVLERLNLSIDPRSKVRTLRIAQQQLIEIARGISSKARVVIMDEPTDALTTKEVDVLFNIINKLKRQGVLVIYITHRLEEIFEISDRVTILKDGQWVDTMQVRDTDSRELARLMVGRPLEAMFPESKNKMKSGQECFRVEGLSTPGVVKNINLSLSEGEIVGLAGLVGSGRTELVHALFGFGSIDSGKIWVKGSPCVITSPNSAIRVGIGYVTSDRKQEGLVLSHSVRANMALPSLIRRQRLGFVNGQAEKNAVKNMISQLNIRTSSMNQLVKNLSGGNQQKVVLAKWLMNDPDILFFNEPTRGVDVGAKEEIYKIMRQMADDGKTILMISSELPEILGMSDRIMVMHRGKLVGQLEAKKATEEKVMLMATGQTENINNISSSVV